LTPTGGRRGPDLPYSVIAAVTPCASGWLIASAKLHGATLSPEDPRLAPSFADVFDERPAFAVVALNAPVGYESEKELRGRTCDREARALLHRRGSIVHNAPSWAASDDGVSISEEHLDAITAQLLPRYREVAAEMAPYRQRVVYEVNPELSFYQLNNDEPLRWSKRFEEGREERRVLLDSKVPDVDRIVEAVIPGVSVSHLLDAAACLWTARRVAARVATRVPIDPEWDGQGLRMEIVR
jgi:predicted RNase H-like nuclease